MDIHGSDDDKPQHECGVFGIRCHDREAARLAFFGLYALQHRGQESAGIATSHEHSMHVHKDMGLVSQVFTEDAMKGLKGTSAIGHTRYSTAGGSMRTNAQPFVLETDLGQVAVAHNGQLTRQKALRAAVLRRGVGLFTHTDSEVIAQCMARPPQEPSPDHPFLKHYFPPGAGTSGLAPTARGEPAVALGAAAVGSGGDTTPPRVQDGSKAPPSPIPAVRVDTPRGRDTFAVQVPPPGRGGEVLPHPQDPGNSVEFRLAALVGESEGAFAFTVLTHHALYGVRDRFGLRPLCIGACVEGEEEGGGKVSFCLSSESCALGTVGYTFVREVHPGEIVRITDEGVSSWWALPTLQPSVPPALCVFEYVYFSRPDTVLEGQLVHTVRQRLGAQLALESPVPHADIVSGVPDSSVAAGIGFAAATGKPFTEILCKNRYIGRTFIQPDQMMRDNSIKLKFNPLGANIAGKVVVLVDDSIVRGSTMRQMVPLLRKAGAAEVHIRISSPPLRHPCYMGVDIGSYTELIAHREGTVPGIAAHLGADSLAFLSHDGMMHAVTLGVQARAHPAYTHTPTAGPAAAPHPSTIPHRRVLAAGTAAGGATGTSVPGTSVQIPADQGGFHPSLWKKVGSEVEGAPAAPHTVGGYHVPGDVGEEGGLVGYPDGGTVPPPPTRLPPPATQAVDTMGATASPPPYVRTTARGHCTACFNGEYPLPLDETW